VISELHRTWRRPEAAENTDIYTVATPNYRAVMESYDRAKSVGTAQSERTKQLEPQPQWRTSGVALSHERNCRGMTRQFPRERRAVALQRSS
jgi:hypothetical protein